MFPINHKYRNKVYHGDFTYIKNDKKSQIDFALTNKEGRKCILSFEVKRTNWHTSDHRPIELIVEMNMSIVQNVACKS